MYPVLHWNEHSVDVCCEPDKQRRSLQEELLLPCYIEMLQLFHVCLSGCNQQVKTLLMNVAPRYGLGFRAIQLTLINISLPSALLTALSSVACMLYSDGSPIAEDAHLMLDEWKQGSRLLLESERKALRLLKLEMARLSYRHQLEDEEALASGTPPIRVKGDPAPELEGSDLRRSKTLIDRFDGLQVIFSYQTAQVEFLGEIRQRFREAGITCTGNEAC